jgi:hypothetical protein
MQQLVQEELKGIFRPEFLNRVDEVVVFQSLRRQDVREIAEVEFAKVATRLSDVGFSVTLTEAFKERVVSEGFFPAYGARPLRRAITRLLEDPLSEHLLGLHLNASQGGSGGSNSSSELATANNTSSGDVSDGEFPDPVPPTEEQRPDNEAYHFEESAAAAPAAAAEGYCSDDGVAALSEADVTTEDDNAQREQTEAHELEDSTAAAAVEAYHSETAAAEDFYNEEFATESEYAQATDTRGAADAPGTELRDSNQTVKGEEESEPAVEEHAEVLLDGDMSPGKEHHADPELQALVVDVDVSGQVCVKSS